MYFGFFGSNLLSALYIFFFMAILNQVNLLFAFQGIFFSSLIVSAWFKRGPKIIEIGNRLLIQLVSKHACNIYSIGL